MNPRQATEIDLPIREFTKMNNHQRFSWAIRFLCFATVGFAALFAPQTRSAHAQSEAEYAKRRKNMVEYAVRRAGVKDARVLKAMTATPRHQFVPKAIRSTRSYLDAGVPIGESQTISSPFIVAYMTQELDPQPTDKVLEIGTGSGYQAAVLSPLVKEVYSIEIVEPLGKTAAKVLKKLKYKNVFTKIGDGYLGWEEHAPFDKIIVTCSPESIPQPLIDQLKEGGTVVVPMGERHQQTLYLMEKQDGKIVRKALRPTLFVPMTGEAEEKREVKPDPANPTLVNGDFEEGLNKQGFAKGWYYQRQMTLEKNTTSEAGSYIKFKNDVPGQLSQLMQGFAIDGRKVSLLEFQMDFACETVTQGNHKEALPAATISFYDEEREYLSVHTVGPFKNTEARKTHFRRLRVPIAAREAIVRVGLFGATGTASFDNVKIKKAK